MTSDHVVVNIWTSRAKRGDSALYGILPWPQRGLVAAPSHRDVLDTPLHRPFPPLASIGILTLFARRHDI